jgi:sugar transferase EpsL
MYRRWGKRLLDLSLGGAAGLLAAPAMGILSILLFLSDGLPVLFVQERPGMGGRPFRIFKFRTMKNSLDGQGRFLPDAARLTSFGKFLRSTSLDELPEILNVLMGDMSLVGPRPLLMQYLDRYTAEQARRHEVKPGITGWAQVNGRNAITWEEKFQLDVWYVDNCSFRLDLRIRRMTLAKVFRREGIRQEGQATMEEFMGSGKPRGD